MFDVYDYNRYLHKYITLTPMNIEWAMWDYLKPGLPEYEGGIYYAKVKESYKKDGISICKLEFDENISKEYGLPVIWAIRKPGDLEIRWFNKKASRLPQAFWLKFKGLKEAWSIGKMGKLIKPGKILGSPLIMATDHGIINGDTSICPLDSALVAPYGRRLLDYDLTPGDEDMYFNLYNNIWNTNFPMWYSDNTRFRFIIKQIGESSNEAEIFGNGG